eukprot:210507_1
MQIQQVIAAATDQRLVAPDWGKNTQICEIANIDPERCAVVVQAIVRKLENPNSTVVGHSLTLLDSLIKNGRPHVHLAVSNEWFMEKVAGVVYNQPDPQVRDQALRLISAWSSAFQARGPEYAVFHKTFVRLQSEGVRFPSDKGDAPVFTPPISTEVTADESSDPSAVTPAYMKRIQRDLNVVVNYVELAHQMMIGVDSEYAQLKQNDTLSTLMQNLKQIQTRFYVLIVEVPHEHLVDLIIELNDIVFETLEWYHQLLRGRPTKSVVFPKQEIMEEIGSLVVDEIPIKDEVEKSDAFTALAHERTVPNDNGLDEIQVDFFDSKSGQTDDDSLSDLLHLSSSSAVPNSVDELERDLLDFGMHENAGKRTNKAEN